MGFFRIDIEELPAVSPSSSDFNARPDDDELTQEEIARAVEAVVPKVYKELRDALRAGGVTNLKKREARAEQKMARMMAAIGALQWNDHITLGQFLKELVRASKENVSVVKLSGHIMAQMERNFGSEAIDTLYLNWRNVELLLTNRVFSLRELEMLVMMRCTFPVDQRLLLCREPFSKRIGTVAVFFHELQQGSFDAEIVAAVPKEEAARLGVSQEVLCESILAALPQVVRGFSQHPDIGVPIHDKTGIGALHMIIEGMKERAETLDLTEDSPGFAAVREHVPTGVFYKDFIRLCLFSLELIQMRLPDGLPDQEPDDDEEEPPALLQDEA